MKKLPEFIALGLGLGMISLVGAVASSTVGASEADPQGLTASTAQVETVQRASVLPTGR
ncbi:MAG: hypothetical protein AAFV53_14800 [Myxococcota bacterium]